jgi:Flp pilus assembly protein TadD
MNESGKEKLVASINAPKPVTPPDTAPAPAITNAPPAPPPVAPAAGSVADLLNEARAAVALKDYDTAGAKYDTVLAKDSQNVTALAQLGVIRYRQKRLDEAEESLRKAVALAPNDAASRALLGVVCVRKGKVEQAYGELTRAVALDPHNAEAHNYLGVVLNEKGWATSAEQEIRRALDLEPKYAEAHFNLAVIYSRRKTPRWDLAKYHYLQAIELGAEHDATIEALLKEHDTEKK